MVRWKAAAIGVLVAACSTAESPVLEQAEAGLEHAAGAVSALPDLEGVIRELAPEGWILVEALDAEEPRRVRIGYETNLQHGEGVAGHWGDLAVGRRVSVWLRDAGSEAPARVVIMRSEPTD